MLGGKKQKYYAVSVGRDGPMIYMTWDECKAKVTRFPGAVFKSFLSQNCAEEWLKARTTNSSVATVPQNKLLSAPNPTPLPDPTIPPAPNKIVLSRDQQRILDRVKQGLNVFFTGSAGTGKSVLLRAIIDHFRSKPTVTASTEINIGGCAPPSHELAITASTGIAAVNIGGCTLHSWAGIGLGEQSVKALAGKFVHQEKYEPVKIRWQDVKTLIIDEISMIDGKLFDKLEHLARVMRCNERPFGGIQLVLSGDFCQLPPVPGRGLRGEEIPAMFAFEAQSWNACIAQPMNLTEVFRQKDQVFVDMLNALRFGRTNTKITRAFKQLSRTVMYDDGIDPMELFPTRQEVENANKARLMQLSDASRTYNAMDLPGLDSNGRRVTIAQMERLLDRMVAQKSLVLKKVGAQVMLIKNLVQGELVNGSLGKVIEFKPLERTDDRPADTPSSQLWPVVKFTNGRVMTVAPKDFTVNNAIGEVEAQRTQIPLILAYALSVHKSQGQTLERVKIDLKRTFEKGQAYVALSRATTMERLQVLNFDPMKIVAHPRVLEWHGITEDMSEIYDDFDEEMDSFNAIATYYSR